MQTYPRDGLAAELGGEQVAAPKEGSFSADAQDEDDDNDNVASRMQKFRGTQPATCRTN